MGGWGKVNSVFKKLREEIIGSLVKKKITVT